MNRWSTSFERAADKDIQRPSSADRGRVLRYLADRVATLDEPGQLGKALKATFAGAWRYRVGDIRVSHGRMFFDRLATHMLAFLQQTPAPNGG